jgi:hypothetical protein
MLQTTDFADDTDSLGNPPRRGVPCRGFGTASAAADSLHCNPWFSTKIAREHSDQRGERVSRRRTALGPSLRYRFKPPAKRCIYQRWLPRVRSARRQAFARLEGESMVCRLASFLIEPLNRATAPVTPDADVSSTSAQCNRTFRGMQAICQKIFRPPLRQRRCALQHKVARRRRATLGPGRQRQFLPQRGCACGTRSAGATPLR